MDRKQRHVQSDRKGRKQSGEIEQQADKVVLRRWRQGGGTIALFPEAPATTDGLVMSYQHVGQHGAADYRHVMGKTVPVPTDGPDQERDGLLDELRSVGYNPGGQTPESQGKGIVGAQQAALWHGGPKEPAEPGRTPRSRGGARSV